MPIKTKNIVDLRWAKIAQIMKSQKLDIVMVCASLQDFGFGYALSGLKPILYHYLTLDPKSGKVARGYFIPYFLADRLGLAGKSGVVTFDDKIVPKEFKKFLSGKKRVGIAGPAPAIHFSQSDSQLVFLDEVLWPLLNVKSPAEIAGVRATSAILKKVLLAATKMVKAGVKLESLAGDLDREVLKEADALAFPCLVESDHGGHQILSLLGVETKIRSEDAIYINIGAEHDGFYADVGRMYFLQNAELKKKYALLVKAFDRFIKRLRPGLLLCHLPALLQEDVKRARLPGAKLNDSYLGHSVGFNIINLPYIGRGIFTTEKLQAHTTISFFVEAKVDGALLKLQETVLIGERGNAILTK